MKFLKFSFLFVAALVATFLNVAAVATAHAAVGAYAVLKAFGVHFAPVALAGNNLSTDLILDTIGKRTMTTLGNVFAPLSAFASDFSDEMLVQGQNVRVPLANVGATAQINPTNWESGDTNIGNINVLVSQYSVSFQLTPRELNSGFRLGQLVDINLQNFANKVMDVAFTPLTTTNFQNITVAQTSIAAANLKTAWGLVAKSPVKNIILDGTAFAQFLPSDRNSFVPGQGAYGYDGFFLNTRWTGAGTNIYGYAGGRNSLAFVAGLPTLDDETRADINATTISVPLQGGSTLQVQASTWLSRATRTRWASWDIMFGASKADNTAGLVFKSA
jgi:hypothetical protein